MKILGIDTCTNFLSMAIVKDGSLLVSSIMNLNHTVEFGRCSSELIIPELKNMLGLVGFKMEDIDVFSTANGPGSYTGLRIGISTIKAFGRVFGKPCLGVSTLEVLSLSCPKEGYSLCLIDAKNANYYISLWMRKDGHNLEVIFEDEFFSRNELVEKISKLSIKSLFVSGLVREEDIEYLKSELTCELFFCDILIKNSAMFAFNKIRNSSSKDKFDYRLLKANYVKKYKI